MGHRELTAVTYMVHRAKTELVSIYLCCLGIKSVWIFTGQSLFYTMIFYPVTANKYPVTPNINTITSHVHTVMIYLHCTQIGLSVTQ